MIAVHVHFILFFCLFLPLTDKIKMLLKNVMYSEEGSTEREKEAATYMLFLDFLYEIEENVHEGI